MKRLFITLSFIALSITNALADVNYDFSAVCSSGQTLYYKIINDSEPYSAMVTYPCLSGNNFYTNSISPLGDLVIPESVINGGISYSVIEIGECAFRYCSNLTSVTIPSTITSIGSYAFGGCSGLTLEHIPNSVMYFGIDVFEHCDNLQYNKFDNAFYLGNIGNPYMVLIKAKSTDIQSCIINSKCRIIESYAFKDCGGLTSIIIPDSVFSIGWEAFCNCSKLTRINIPNSVKLIDEWAFYGCDKLQYNQYDNALYLGNEDNPYVVLFKAYSTNITSCKINSNCKFIYDDAFFKCNNLSSIDIPNSVIRINYQSFNDCCSLTSVVIPNSVTYIGDWAFEGCSSLKSVSIPNSVKSIGVYAFASSGLTSVSIPNSVKSIEYCTFADCSELTSITIPDSVIKIKERAFANCSNLVSAKIGNNVTYIGQSAFNGCEKLTTVTFPNSLKSIDAYAFAHCGLTSVMIGDSVIDVAGSSFAYCENLKNVFIPKSVKYVRQNAFFSCNATIYCEASQKPADWPANWLEGNSGSVVWNCKRIGDFVYAITSDSEPYTAKICVYNGNNTMLTVPSKVTIDDIEYSITEIADYAFKNCINLTSVTIPNSVTSIGEATFSGCSSLESITLPFVGTTINSSSSNYLIPFGYIFGEDSYSGGTQTGQNIIEIENGNTSSRYYYIPTSLKEVTITGSSEIPIYAFHNCSNLTSITIPNTVTSIHSYAFESCTGLISITIPNTVLSIGNYAFSNCTSIKTINISNSVLSIGQYAFSNCTSLTSVIIPKSVSRIEKAAFYGCALQSITIEKPTPPVLINTDAIQSNIPIYIPCGSLSAYQSANNWDNYIYAEKLMHKLVISSADTEKGNVEITREPTCDKSAIIQATAKSGYLFYQWSDGNKSNPRYLTVTQDTVLTAYFVADEIDVEIASANTAQGTVSNSSGTYYYNDEIEISATANYGYHFARWSDGVTTNQRTIVLKRDTVIEAEFAVNQYTITLKTNNAVLGSVAGGGTFNYLSNNEISATANEGYVFAKWEDGNTSNPRTVSLTCDTTFTAVFVPAEYDLTVTSANTSLGSVTGSATIKYKETAAITATATAAHHHFVAWSDGNRQNPRTVQVLSDTVLVAMFAIDSFNIAATSNNEELGIVTGGGLIAYGTAVEVKALPQPHCHFVEWSNGANGTAQTFNVEKDTAIAAVFAIDSHRLQVASADSAKGTVTGSGNYDYGRQITVSATAAAGCYFTGWSDGTTANPRIITIESDTTVVANFEQMLEFSITVVPSDTARGTVSGTGKYVSGTEATLSATPRQHYLFSQWSDGRTDNPRTVRVIADATYKAVFVPEQYNVVLSQNNADMGMVSGSGVYSYGERASCLAKPYPNYHFVQWSNGETANPYEFVIEGNQLLTAYFAAGAVTGISDDAAAEPVIYAVGKTIVVENATDEICVYDAMGRLIGRDVARNVCTINVGKSGVYIVKTGNVIKRVMIND